MSVPSTPIDYSLAPQVVNLHHLCTASNPDGDKVAIRHGQKQLTFSEYQRASQALASALASEISVGDRVAIYLPKCLEAAVALTAVSAAGGVIVPVNPVLKPTQVEHILADSGAKVLISQTSRIAGLEKRGVSLAQVQCIKIDDKPCEHGSLSWPTAVSEGFTAIEQEPDALAALLYTSGSTGLPKGVMLSHRNLLLGVTSVVSYLAMQPSDVVLAALPFSFDYGLNQLLSSLAVGAECVLLDYLLPKDIIKACERFGVTALAGVPPMWAQIANLEWPASVQKTLRYVTNSGGHLSQAMIGKLRQSLPNTDIVPMYGLTEAFRSSYLPPAMIASKPNSMGRAIPHAKLWVLKPDGSECVVNEVGELVHSGELVALGYWNRPEKTRQTFKPLPTGLDNDQVMAVWSGDDVYRDEDGYLFYSGRRDNQIKVSGYRISPEEVEQALSQCAGVAQVVAFGVADEALGQALVVVIESASELTEKACRLYCRQHLPAYMQPKHVSIQIDLPRNPNGKLDRVAVRESFSA